MGNCQAIDAATLVVQHPSGKVDTFYLPVSAGEVMRMNPGHYVALLLSTTLYRSNSNGECPDNAATTATTTSTNSSVRLTRIKLLRPTDTLALGHVYRLIPTQEVMKGLWTKKQAKLKKNEAGSAERLGTEARSELGQYNQKLKTSTAKKRTPKPYNMSGDPKWKEQTRQNSLNQPCLSQIKNMATLTENHLRGCQLILSHQSSCHPAHDTPQTNGGLSEKFPCLCKPANPIQIHHHEDRFLSELGKE